MIYYFDDVFNDVDKLNYIKTKIITISLVSCGSEINLFFSYDDVMLMLW